MECISELNSLHPFTARLPYSRFLTLHVAVLLICGSLQRHPFLELIGDDFSVMSLFCVKSGTVLDSPESSRCILPCNCLSGVLENIVQIPVIAPNMIRHAYHLFFV